MKRIFFILFIGFLILSPLYNATGQSKKDQADSNSADIKVLEERIEKNEEQTKIQLENQQKEIDEQKDDLQREMELRSENNENEIESVEKQVDYIWKFGLLILAILSFIGYKVILTWIRNAIEDKTQKMIDENEKIIIKKGEETLSKRIKELEEKWDERFSILEKRWNKEYEKHLNKFKDEKLSVDKPISENTKRELDDFKEKLEKVKEEKDYTFDDWFYKGIGEYNKGKFDNALKSFTKAIELDPNNSLAYNNRGATYNNQKRYNEALEDLNKAIELDPDKASAYNNRGATYSNRKRYDEALQDYNKAIELDPNNALAYNNRGNIYNSQKKCDEALKDYNKAIELDPNNALAYNNRGNIYNSQKIYDEALKDYNKAIELDPKNICLHLCMCEALITIGDINKADEVIKKMSSIITQKTEIENKAIFIFLKLVFQNLEGTDTNQTEIEFNNLLKEEFEITYSFDELETWLKETDISEDKKNFIRGKIELLKKKKKD